MKRIIIFVVILVGLGSSFFIGVRTHSVSSIQSKAITTSIEEDFESVDNLESLLIAGDSFNSFVTLSPSTPSVAEYVALRNCIANKECTFIDNLIELSTEHAVSGVQSMKLTAVQPIEGIVSKSLLENTRLNVVRGDTVWFSGWFYIESGWPTTLVDFEDGTRNESPGLRITNFEPERVTSVELKHLFKPTFNQLENIRVVPPIGKWFNISAQIVLASNDEGMVRVWHNCELIIDDTGTTLPGRTTTLDKMEVGITATEQDTVLFIDDIFLSTKSSQEDLLSRCRK